MKYLRIVPLLLVTVFLCSFLIPTSQAVQLDKNSGEYVLVDETVNLYEFSYRISVKTLTGDVVGEFDQDYMKFLVYLNGEQVLTIYVWQKPQKIGVKEHHNVYYYFVDGQSLPWFYVCFSSNKSKIQFKYVDEESGEHKLQHTVKKSFTPPVHVKITAEVVSGDETWEVSSVYIDAYKESVGGIGWKLMQAFNSAWEATIAKIPVIGDVLTALKDAMGMIFTDFIVPTLPLLPKLIGFSGGFYGMYLLFLLIKSLRDMDPSPIVNHFETLAQLAIWIYNMFANIVKAIISLIKWW